jgi:hypothetical protein
MSRLLQLVSLVVLGSIPQAAAQDPAPRVTCGASGDPESRSWVLEQMSGRWQLSYTSRTATRPVRLALPAAQPEITANTARLEYKNANGGRQVDLRVGGGPSALEVWVDHGLEVNIEPDLDPRVDDMNTHGPLQGVQCTIESSPRR